jgi:ABC-2 type transport system permease protein
MNFRGGWALIKSTWLSWMQHRSFFFLLAFLWMIPPLIYLFVWSTAASGETVGGLTRGEFVAYYLVLILVNQLTYSQTNWTVGNLIRDGKMNILLLRPLSSLYDALSSDVASKVVYMTFAIPMAAILALVLRPELHVTPRGGLAFVPALAMAWALRFFWGYWLALLALQDSLVFLLAGQVAPLALLPDLMQKAATVLPFRYMIGFPVEVLTGQLDGVELGIGFAFQAGWLGITLALFVAMWRTGLKHYSAVGG